MKSKLSNKKILIILSLAFILSILVRFYFANFAKVIAAYPDELRYLAIARNIANGHGIMLHHVASDFQKILYSLLIVPAFWIPTTIHRQIQIIALLNCIYMSLSVFPAYFLAKNIFKDSRYSRLFILLLPLFVLFMPDFIYTITFMSEVIFLPLMLLFVYLMYKIFAEKDFKRKNSLSGVAGILLYILYMNKEISLYFIIAYFLVCSILHFTEKSERKSNWASFFICAALFTLCFLIFKVTLFNGMGSSYDQTSLDAILNLHNFAFMIYSFIYSLFIIGIGFYFFPLLLPAFSLRKMEKPQRNLYLLLIFSIFIGAAVIAYTISVREDLDMRSPRQHLRYLIPMFIPLLMIMLNNFRDIKESLVKHKKIFWGFSILFSFLFIIFIEDIALGSHVDQTALKYYIYLPEFLLKTFNIPYNTGLILLRCAIVAVIFLFCFLFLRAEKEKSIVVFASFLLLMNLINTALGTKEYHNIYAIEYENVHEMELLNDFCDTASGTVIGITSMNFTQYDRLLDTYMQEDLYITSNYLISLDIAEGSKAFDFTTTKLAVKFPWVTYQNLTQADYIIAAEDIVLDNVEKIDIPGVTHFSVYKNIEPAKIYSHY
ncbi:MAG: hypothetical protein EOM34_15025 [Clostridia bacterium]|nr:hypothetical protein [Clostridia bacterium]NCD02769.1 hypothetical protein [Clostridia bacterium]